MAESFSREKLRHAPSDEIKTRSTRERKVDEKSCVTPAGTSNELDVQNEWEENTENTHAPSDLCSYAFKRMVDHSKNK